jgi:hypothetical protein
MHFLLNPAEHPVLTQFSTIFRFRENKRFAFPQRPFVWLQYTAFQVAVPPGCNPILIFQFVSMLVSVYNHTMNLNEGTWKWIECLPRFQDMAARHIKCTHLSTPAQNKIKDENYSNMLLNWENGGEEVLLKFKVFFSPNCPLFCVIEVRSCTHGFSVSHPV